MKKIAIDSEKLRQLVLDDIPNHKIAEFFQCSRGTVEKNMRLLGLKKDRTGPKSGEMHPDWSGGTTIRKGYRYIYMPDHPNCINGKYVAEHRLVMESKLGRYLDRKEVVHHKDGNRLNNDSTNLELYPSNGKHLYDHLKDNPEHAEAVRQGMESPVVRQRIREGLAKYHQEASIHHQSELDDQQEPQTTSHPSSQHDSKAQGAS